MTMQRPTTKQADRYILLAFENDTCQLEPFRFRIDYVFSTGELKLEPADKRTALFFITGIFQPLGEGRYRIPGGSAFTQVKADRQVKGKSK